MLHILLEVDWWQWLIVAGVALVAAFMSGV
jgi:hypothetical protein